MKLPIPVLDLKTQLLEFDVWITPSLGEITETEKFREQLQRVVRVFEIIDEATQHFADPRHCQPSAISAHFVECIQALPDKQTRELL